MCVLERNKEKGCVYICVCVYVCECVCECVYVKETKRKGVCVCVRCVRVRAYEGWCVHLHFVCAYVPACPVH